MLVFLKGILGRIEGGKMILLLLGAGKILARSSCPTQKQEQDAALNGGLTANGR